MPKTALSLLKEPEWINIYRALFSFPLEA